MTSSISASLLYPREQIDLQLDDPEACWRDHRLSPAARTNLDGRQRR